MIRLLLCRHGQSEADLEPRRPVPTYHRPPEGESYLDLDWHLLHITLGTKVRVVRLKNTVHLEGLT